LSWIVTAALCHERSGKIGWLESPDPLLSTLKRHPAHVAMASECSNRKMAEASLSKIG